MARTLSATLNRLTKPQLLELFPSDVPSNGFDHTAAIRAKLIEHLLANPDLVPAEVWFDGGAPQATAEQSEAEQAALAALGAAATSEALAAVAARVAGSPLENSIATALSSMSDHLHTISGQIGGIDSRLQTVENMVPAQPGAGLGHQSEPLSAPNPHPSLSAAAAAVETARAFAPTIPVAVIQSVVDCTMEGRNVHKLDPAKVDEVIPLTHADDATAAMFGSLVRTAGERRTRAHSKYPDVASMARSWIKFCQIKDLVDLGSGKYYLGHLEEIYRLHRIHPNSFSYES